MDVGLQMAQVSGRPNNIMLSEFHNFLSPIR
jgi:hypothetical protein